MTEPMYKFVEPVGGFDEDDIASVTARFGDWHLYDLRLTSASNHLPTSVELTEATLELVTEPVTQTEGS